MRPHVWHVKLDPNWSSTSMQWNAVAQFHISSTVTWETTKSHRKRLLRAVAVKGDATGDWIIGSTSFSTWLHINVLVICLSCVLSLPSTMFESPCILHTVSSLLSEAAAKEHLRSCFSCLCATECSWLSCISFLYKRKRCFSSRLLFSRCLFHGSVVRL